MKTTKKKKNILYLPGKIKALVEGVARMVSLNPDVIRDFARMHASIAAKLPGYGDKSHCFNCGRRMPKVPTEKVENPLVTPTEEPFLEWWQTI